ncbi:MAG: amidohydrolase, partial [Planctomycetes bacterium]|nr:amidohydrolase [Planctomycetota bacterium]
MAAVLPEAYELVEDELIDKDNFKSFVFGNAVRFWGEMNPSFFDGTVVEKQARALLRE